MVCPFCSLVFGSVVAGARPAGSSSAPRLGARPPQRGWRAVLRTGNPLLDSRPVVLGAVPEHPGRLRRVGTSETAPTLLCALRPAAQRRRGPVCSRHPEGDTSRFSGGPLSAGAPEATLPP